MSFLQIHDSRSTSKSRRNRSNLFWHSRICVGNLKALRGHIVKYSFAKAWFYGATSHHREVDKCASFCPAEKQTSLRASPSASFPRNHNARGEEGRGENGEPGRYCPIDSSSLWKSFDCEAAGCFSPGSFITSGTRLSRPQIHANISLFLFLFFERHRPSIDLRARKTWKILWEERTN